MRLWFKHGWLKSVSADRVPVRAGLTVTFASARNAAVCPMLSATKAHAA